MTARTPPPPARPASDRPGPSVRNRWDGLSGRLRTALTVAVAGALALAIGPLLPVVSPATPAGFSAGPLLFVLGVLPAAVALVLAGAGRPAAAGAALAAAALFAPGRAVSDAQLAVDGSVASRPELVLPQSLQPLHAGPGLWLLLLGHLLTLAAGLLAVGQGDRAVRASQPGGAARPGAQQGPLFGALCVGVAASLGLLGTPFTSDDPLLLARGALDGPTWSLVGGLLVAVAVPLAATVALTTTDRAATRGWLLGTAAVVVALALPSIVSGLAVPRAHPSWAPYLALAAAVGLAALAGIADRTVPAAVRAASPAEAEPAELRLPGPTGLHQAAGVLGVLACGAALVGALAPRFVVPADLPHPADLSGRPLVPAALLVGLLGAALLVPRWAALVRPAFAVAWVAIPVAGAAALDTALNAMEIDGVEPGVGTWLTGVAGALAVAGACCAGLAGSVERDDVDLTELSARPAMIGPAVAAAVLAFGAFGLPLLAASGYTAAGLWSNFRIASWGQLFGLLAVLLTAAVAPVCRPGRAVALLLGAAGVVGVRLLELPLTRAAAPGATVDVGTWLGLACVVALMVGAVVAFRTAAAQPAVAPVATPDRPRSGRGGTRPGGRNGARSGARSGSRGAGSRGGRSTGRGTGRGGAGGGPGDGRRGGRR